MMSKDSTYGEIASNDGVHVHVGDINVLRWRGYYYDDETGLNKYLRSGFNVFS